MIVMVETVLNQILAVVVMVQLVVQPVDHQTVIHVNLILQLTVLNAVIQHGMNLVLAVQI